MRDWVFWLMLGALLGTGAVIGFVVCYALVLEGVLGGH
jgi:uncharacterized membrane protein (Fun14 family)